MSPTPRVDEAAERGSDLGMANMTWSGIWPLARTLERELADAVEVLRIIEDGDRNSIGEFYGTWSGSQCADMARAFLQRVEQARENDGRPI